MAGTHYDINARLKYAWCMIQGMSIQRSAQQVGIRVPTAFYWRHKILSGLRQLPKPNLTGIVEADETFFLESQKGSRHLTRAARYSGGKAALRVISHYQVSVLVARDRQEGTVSEVTGFGHVTAKQLQGAMNGCVQNCIPCTDAASAYGAFTRTNKIPLQILNAKRGVHELGI